MNEKRRLLLQSLAALPLLTASDITKKDEDVSRTIILGNKEPLRVRGFVQLVRCEYPESMSFEDFTRASEKWTKPYLIPQIDKAHHEMGGLEHVERFNSKGLVEWQYKFKTRKDFRVLVDVLTAQKAFNENLVPSNFTYTFTYFDINEKGEISSYESKDRPLADTNLNQHIVSVGDTFLSRRNGFRALIKSFLGV